MNAAEYQARYLAAVKRISVDPTHTALFLLASFAGMCVRTIAHICVGFGAASLAGASAWWGLPLALVSVQTVGRVWLWARRGARVEGAEALADVVEKRGAEKAGGGK